MRELPHQIRKRCADVGIIEECFGRGPLAPRSQTGIDVEIELETKLRMRTQNAFAVHQCHEAVETLWACYGANAIYTRDPLQRFQRDLQAMKQHFSFNFDIAGAAYGLVALGGSFASPTM